MSSSEEGRSAYDIELITVLVRIHPILGLRSGNHPPGQPQNSDHRRNDALEHVSSDHFMTSSSDLDNTIKYPGDLQRPRIMKSIPLLTK